MTKHRTRTKARLRQDAYRDPVRRLLIVCEGAVTEPSYFHALAAWRKQPGVVVETHGPAGVPQSLVDRATSLRDRALEDARRERDDNLEYSEVWCCFDVDAHPDVPAARRTALDRGLKLAMSNPCFEFWLYLHYADSPGAQGRHDMQRLLRERQAGVTEKHVDFERLIPGYDAAIDRARRILGAAHEQGEPTRNPTTEIVNLVEVIDAEGREARLRAHDSHREETKAANMAKAERAARDALLQAGAVGRGGPA